MSMLEDIKAAEKAADELKKEKTAAARTLLRDAQEEARDRKSTRLNSSHSTSSRMPSSA